MKLPGWLAGCHLFFMMRIKNVRKNRLGLCLLPQFNYFPVDEYNIYQMIVIDAVSCGYFYTLIWTYHFALAWQRR